MRAESVEAAGRGGMTPGAVLTAPAAGHVREAGERRLRRSPLAIVYLTVFIDLLGFSIILPLLPFYAERFGATGAWVGTLLTAYAAVQCVSAPLLGRLSDRVGRRPVLLLSLAGSAASLALTGVANSLVLLLAGRALAGLFGGSISTAQAYVADMTEPRERAKYMGLLGAAIGLGFVFGPAIGAGLAPLGFGAAAFAAAGLAAANLAFACLRLPESHGDRGWNRHTRASLASLLAGSRRSGAGRTLAGIFLATFAFVSLEATFALFSQQQFGLGPAGFGIVFTYLGLLIVCVQGGLVGRLSRRYEERAWPPPAPRLSAWRSWRSRPLPVSGWRCRPWRRSPSDRGCSRPRSLPCCRERATRASRAACSAWDRPPGPPPAPPARSPPAGCSTSTAPRPIS